MYCFVVRIAIAVISLLSSRITICELCPKRLCRSAIGLNRIPQSRSMLILLTCCACNAAASGEVKPRDGVLELFDEARALGLKVGVCSAATKSSAICVLENLLGMDRFRVRWFSPFSSSCHCSDPSFST